MTTLRTKDGLMVPLPPGVDPRGPEAKQLVARARAERTTARDNEGFAPTAGMSLSERLDANLGAGIDTAVQGIKQVFGGGPSDEELLAKRARDEQLAKSTTGGGITQVVGESLPYVVPGMGAYGVAGRVLPQAGRVAKTLMAAGEGAAIGAMQPVTSDESRAKNAGIGAAGGVVARPVAAALGLAGRATGRVADNILAGAGEFLPNRFSTAAGERVGQRMLKRTLQESGITPADLRQRYHEMPGLAPPTASMATQSPRVAMLERAHRAADPEGWAARDQAAAHARWRELNTKLAGQAEEDTIRREADATGAAIQGVYQQIKPQEFLQGMSKFYDDIQVAKQTPQYHANPAVKQAVDYIEDTMRRAQLVTPELVHQMRRTIKGGLQGTPGLGDQAARAASKDPLILSIADNMDSVLDNASNGAFRQWRQDYSSKMVELEAARADRNIRNAFVDQTGLARVNPLEVEGGPSVTAHKLRQALATKGVMQRGPRKGQDVLKPQSRELAQGVLNDLDAQGILQRVKHSGTGLGGSNTAMDTGAAAGLGFFIEPTTGAAYYLNRAGRNVGTRNRNEALGRLLSDRDALRSAVMGNQLRQPPGPARLGAGALGAVPLLGLTQQ